MQAEHASKKQYKTAFCSILAHLEAGHGVEGHAHCGDDHKHHGDVGHDVGR